MSELPMSVHEAKAILAADTSLVVWAEDVSLETIDTWRRIVEVARERLKSFTTDKRTITGKR